jgi:hypothetical protein
MAGSSLSICLFRPNPKPVSPTITKTVPAIMSQCGNSKGGIAVS